MGKFEIKMHFEKFHVKIVKSGFWKSGSRGNGLNWYRYNQHTIVFSDKFYEKSPNFAAVAVLVVMIQSLKLASVPPPLPPHPPM